MAARVPPDWTFIKSTTCNVAIPLPPKNPPYYNECSPSENTCTGLSYGPSFLDDTRSGRFWHYEEFGDEYNATNGRTARVIYLFPTGGGSDVVVSGLVDVNCWPNTSGYSTEGWFARMLYAFKRKEMDTIAK